MTALRSPITRVVGPRDHGRVRIGVDRHDVLRALAARQVLYGTTDPARHVELRGDAGARLADLLAVRAPTRARDGARDTDGRSEQAGELLDGPECLGTSYATPASHDDPGFAREIPAACWVHSATRTARSLSLKEGRWSSRPGEVFCAAGSAATPSKATVSRQTAASTRASSMRLPAQRWRLTLIVVGERPRGAETVGDHGEFAERAQVGHAPRCPGPCRRRRPLAPWRRRRAR